jgi:uncharacterized protein YyaL (SSP411 family)
MITLRPVSPNHLEAASSPYLLQHAENPVDWHEWGPEALALAERLDRPLFISIGYASCHWCHVMAHESFEDPRVAERVNDAFIAIKVDREERPDLDQLYMAATQAATGQGGWPMTIFATPDGRPFFAGTYFPPVDRGGQPSFSRVLDSLQTAWQTRRGEVEEQADALAHAVETEATFADTLGAEVDASSATFAENLHALVSELAGRFDLERGGFGGAPKFPRPSYVQACLIHHRRTGDPAGLTMATVTLDAMAAGGIYDHLAGGFARYAVDADWRVPHFEKMLTDQALLARCYLDAYLLAGNADYAQVVTETLDWVCDELALSSGGLASSVDADAAGREGSHAVFTPDEVARALEGVEGALSPDEACARYHVTEAGTFERGASVLALSPGAALARDEAHERTRLALLAARRDRPAPGIDDKVLVEWNAMAAAALARASAVLGVERWGAKAVEIVEHLDQRCRDDAGRLLRSERQGRAQHLAVLADHAWLIEAMTQLFELDGEDRWLRRAAAVAQETIELFYDGEPPSATTPESGRGFFTTGHDAPALLTRSKEVFDGALPSASAVIAISLSRLAALLGDADLEAVARRTTTLLGPLLERHPMAVPDLVLARGWLDEGLELAVPGPPGPLLEAARSPFAPFMVIAHGSSPHSDLLASRSEGLAYLCRHRVCDRPTDDPAVLITSIEAAVQG